MKLSKWTAFLAAGTLAASLPAFPAAPAVQERGQALVTILPKHDTLSSKGAPSVTPNSNDLQLKINGKTTPITSVTRAHGPTSPLELVFLIDSSARSGIGNQLSYLANFARELPPDTRMAVAYMQNGRAVFSGPLSSNSAEIEAGIRLPSGPIGGSGSPYFCLTDLAQHWPSQDKTARREVVMITDGIDNYEPRFNPDDQYVQAAIHDAVRAGLMVYSIYWTNEGGSGRGPFAATGGQSLLLQVTEATGGASYWTGTGNPVSIDPFLKDIRIRLRNQYRIGFEAMARNKPEVQQMRLKLTSSESKLSAPQMVLITPQTGE